MKKQAPKNKQDTKGQFPIDFKDTVNNIGCESGKVISITRTSDRIRNSLLNQIIEKTKSF